MYSFIFLSLVRASASVDGKFLCFLQKKKKNIPFSILHTTFAKHPHQFFYFTHSFIWIIFFSHFSFFFSFFFFIILSIHISLYLPSSLNQSSLIYHPHQPNPVKGRGSNQYQNKTHTFYHQFQQTHKIPQAWTSIPTNPRKSTKLEAK